MDIAVTAGRGLEFKFFFSSRRRHTRLVSDWSSDVSLPISHLRRRQHLLQPLDLAADLRHAARGLLQRAEAALHVAHDLGGGVEPRADARLAGVDQLHPLLELPCDLAGEGADLAAQVLLVLAPLVTHAL